MSIKISIKDAVNRYGVTQRTVYRWVSKYDIKQYADGTFDRDELDKLIEKYENPDYMAVNWAQAACRGLPTDFFYKIEDRGASKLIDVNIFRVVCAPCPIWGQCLGYATQNENYGVWGGMTSEERSAVASHKESTTAKKVFKDFSQHGISHEMIMQAIGRE